MNRAAKRHGFVVVYPGQNRRRNAQGCWNWFVAEHQRRDRGEPAAIAATVRELIDANSSCTIDPARVFVAVHSGLAYRSATSAGSAFEVMSRGGGDAAVQGQAAYAAMGAHARPVPSIVIHGTDDRTVAPVNATQVLRQSMITNHLAAPETCDHDPDQPTSARSVEAESGYAYTLSRWSDGRGALMHELLMIDGLGHAWSGGAAGGSYADPRGPSAAEAIWAFFALTQTPVIAAARAGR
jgi:poly(3-hydroxybutyrate) depolymerase